MAEELTEPLRYRGIKQPAAGAVGANGRRLLPYIPSPDLVDAVNLAIFLGRPLLLRGEPGCGKSLLANALAFEFGLLLESWSIRSTTRAIDGLYIYDAIARLRDAQLSAAGQLAPKHAEHALDANNLQVDKYVRLGPVGRAFTANQRRVLLIDEIDKADIDFPNDILDIIEHPRFTIDETGQEIIAKYQPIIIITSNDEKELPDAFLRRCLFAYVPFPGPERLLKILNAHFNALPADIAELAIQRFNELRSRQEKDSYGGVKKVSTSELIDWMRVLLREPGDAHNLLSGGKPFPHTPVLIKRHEDAEFANMPMGDAATGS